jgi:lipoprotein-releasing system permease protein
MPYESFIGLRILYGGRKRSGLLITWFFLVLVGTVALTAAMAWLTKQPPSIMVVAVIAGALTVVALGLLALFSIFITVSVFGVVLGVACLTVVLAVTSGFQSAFRDKVLGVNAHVLVMKSTPDFANYRDVEEIARDVPGVQAVQPFMFEEMLVTRGKGELSGVALKGIDPDRVGTVLDLPKHMEDRVDVAVLKRGPDEKGRPPLILGKELATKLKAKVGDEVTVVAPLFGIDVKSWTSSGRPPKTRKFVVAGIFHCGFDEYDRRLVYVNLAEAQDFLEQGDVVRGVEMKLDNVDQAYRVARTLEERLGGDPYVVMDWRELNNNLFTALTLQKWALLLFLAIIIIVAAFNMVASLTMLVTDKTKEIAILKAMGSTNLGVFGIFQVVGLTIGAVGTVLGVGLGLLMCELLRRYGYPLDPKVYLIDKLPVTVDPVEIGVIAIVTVVVSFLSTIYPALRAGWLPTVEGLRYE